MPGHMNFEEKFRTKLNEVRQSKGLTRLAELAGVEQSNLSRAMNGQNLGLDKVSRILDALGARISFPGDMGTDTGKDVCFVNARVVRSGSEQAPPDSEDYIAVPMVAEVGAGPGIIPEGGILSWFLVYKHQDAVRYRSNLVAVQIGKHSTSMQPVLAPGDIVLVDLDDRDTSRPGRIMLVMDPQDGSGMIKRVSVEQKHNDYRIMFYSDNAAENPPLVYSWREDFAKDWGKAIAGHVVWAWSDISNK